MVLQYMEELEFIRLICNYIYGLFLVLANDQYSYNHLPTDSFE